MKTTSDNPESWEPCESGLLVDRSKQAKTAQTRKTATQIGGGILTMLLIVGLGAWSINYWERPEEYYFGGIACHEVQENVPGMMAGTLPEDVMQRMQAHLKECPVCQEMMAKMKAQHAEQEQASLSKIARMNATAGDEPVLLAVEPLEAGFLGLLRR